MKFFSLQSDDFFAVFLTLTVFHYFFLESGAVSTGFLLLCWGVMGLLRVLQLAESASGEEGKVLTHSRILPHALLSLMRKRKALNGNIHALRMIGKASMTWLGFMCCFLFLKFLAGMGGIDATGYQNLVERMQDFFAQAGQDVRVSADPFFHHRLIALAQIFMTGFVFMLALTHLRVPGKTLFALVVVLFLASIAVNIFFAGAGFSGIEISFEPQGYGWGAVGILQVTGDLPQVLYSPLQARLIEAGVGAAVFLYAAGVTAAYVFVSRLLRSSRGDWHDVGGLAVLAAMAMCDVFLVQLDKNVALWISGWAFVALCWAAGEHKVRRSFRLHQI